LEAHLDRARVVEPRLAREVDMEPLCERSETMRAVLVARTLAPFDLALRPWFRSLWRDVEARLTPVAS